MSRTCFKCQLLNYLCTVNDVSLFTCQYVSTFFFKLQEGFPSKKKCVFTRKSWQSSCVWVCWWNTEFKQRQKAGSNKALCSMWKIKVSDKEKSMHSLYTSQHPHTFFSLSLSLSLFSFFSQWKSFTQKTPISRVVASPPTRWRLKFISLTPTSPLLLTLPQEVEWLRSPDAIESPSPLPRGNKEISCTLKSIWTNT